MNIPKTFAANPPLEVGILFSSKIHFHLNGSFTCQENGKKYSGEYCISQEANTYRLYGEKGNESVDLPMTFLPIDFKTNDFDLSNVVIGIQFHWERKENQKFKGALKIIDEGKYLTAINILPLEDYLLSVISSEMKATSSLEFLKAHAVISRSWLLAQLANKSKTKKEKRASRQSPSNEYIRWYNREDHLHFDVCADDHCQRYQGISKAYAPTVQTALQATRGEVLMFNGHICDARFSKCCGGMTERFENTWEPIEHPYLDKIADAPDDMPEIGDLREESNAYRWILSSPSAFCNTNDPKILSQVLNDYDQETLHFFRWQVRYTAMQLSELVHRKLKAV